MNRRERLTRTYFCLFFLAFLLLPVLGMSAPVQSGGKPAMEIMGFYTEAEGELPSSFSSLEANAAHMTSIAPFYYRLGSNGELEAQGVGSDHVKMLVDYAHRKNVKVLALVHNLLYDNPGVGRDKAHDILRDVKSRKHFVQEVTKFVQDSGFDGVMLDIEDINFGDRDAYSELVKELNSSFSGRNLTLGVAVPPETGDFVEGSWARNFDYKALGKWADRVVIMTYDEHGYSTGPGPIASRKWVERVLGYSVSVIPREKIMMGIPAYGFDWEEDKPKPQYLSFNQAEAIARAANVNPSFLQNDGVPGFEYVKDGHKHHVFFENAESFQVKVNLAKKWGVGGLALWRLGMEDPGIWKDITNDISVIK